MITKNLYLILAAGLALGYTIIFYQSLEGRFLNPAWTTDDALQQAFMFHDVFDSSIFRGDIIYEVMKGYLPPVHYWLSYFLTWTTSSPILAGHWITLIQIILTLVFIFLSVSSAILKNETYQSAYSTRTLIEKLNTSAIPALFACIWFLHTRTIIQRMMGGLPRGWATVVFAGFLWGILSRNHFATIIILVLGCLLHPPATFLCGVSYGLWLLFLSVKKETRVEGVSALKKLALASPLCGVLTWSVIKRPAEIGNMVDFATASQMPAFTNPGGRFPFIPQPSILEHFHSFAYNPFINRLYMPPATILNYAWIIIFGSLLLMGLISYKTKREIIPSSLWAFLIGIITVYLVSRQVLFKLYVPDRHLLIPMSLFLITTFSIGTWQLFKKGRVIRLILLSTFIFLCSGSGLDSQSQLNYHIHRKGRVFDWIKKYTATDVVVAGHPTQVDPVPLFGARRVYVSSELAHPFYKTFYDEMERRLVVSLKAHYAPTWADFLEAIKGEKIDYFIFSRQRFYPNNLARESYYTPLDTLVKSLCSAPPGSYAYKTLPRAVDLVKFPFVKFIDDQSTIINIPELIQFLKDNPKLNEGSGV